MPRVCCLICKTQFYVKPSHQKLGWGKYCSRYCSNKSQLKGKVFSCFSCGKESYKSPSQQKHSKSSKFFCSKVCQTNWRNRVYVRERHANWKGGIRIYRELLINSDRKISCVLCGISNEKILTAHHKDHDRNNNSLRNLLWLCLNCHYLVHHDNELDDKVRIM